MLTLPDFIEKKILIVYPQKGDIISFSNDNIIIKDRDNKIKCQYTCYKLFMLIIVGGFTITTGIIERANKFNFAIVFMTHSFRPYHNVNITMEGNTLLREKQYNNASENIIQRKIISNKIQNQNKIIGKLRNTEFKEAREILDNYSSKILNEKEMDSYKIMGFEGMASKVYFKCIFSEFNWKGRQPRVKRDSINLLLDIGYTILFNFIESILNIYGFDIYKGVLHKEFFKRKSLVCDIIEVFRPIIDYKTRKLFKLSQVNEEDFIISNGKYMLAWKENAKYMNLYIEEIMEYKEDIFMYIQNYYRWFMKNGSIDNFPKFDIVNRKD